MLGAQFLPLAAQTLPHLLPEAAGINQLNLAFPLGRLAVAQNPDVGADARVVEHVRWQGDDRLQQVVLQHIPPDLAFA